MRIVLLPFILFCISLPSIKTDAEVKIDRSNEVFVLNEYETGKYEITGVTLYDLTEYRVYSSLYSNKVIDKIADNAFDGCNEMLSIMLTDEITNVSQTAFAGASSFNTVYYTGSAEDYAKLNLVGVYTKYVYACDEGFINYWDAYIRPTQSSSLCDVSEEIYQEMKDKYSSLGSQEREFVDIHTDKAGSTIKSSLDYLDTYFKNDVDPIGPKKEMNKNTAIALIITASIIGMTSISMFFFLKQKNIIG